MLSLPPRDPNLDFLSTYLEPQGFLDCNFYGRSVQRKVVGGDFPFPQTFDNHDTTSWEPLRMLRKAFREPAIVSPLLERGAHSKLLLP